MTQLKHCNRPVPSPLHRLSHEALPKSALSHSSKPLICPSSQLDGNAVFVGVGTGVTAEGVAVDGANVEPGRLPLQRKPASTSVPFSLAG